MTDNTPDSLDLDSLLADSMQARAAKQAAKPRTPKPKEMSPANSHWLNAKDKSDYERRLENAALKALWRPEAAVAMFATQVCLSCGATHTHFEGFFLQQRHAEYLHAERWIPAPDSTSLRDLPKQQKTTIHEADACRACIESLGYTTISPTQTEPEYASWSPRKHYPQHPDEHFLAGGFGSES